MACRSVVFVELTGLLIPSFIAVILPITTFVVVQFVYQRLAGDREITVMRAAGLSPFALSRPALALAAAGGRLRLRTQPVDRARQPHLVPRSSSGRSATAWRRSCCRKACSRRSPTISPSMCVRAIRTARCAASWWTTDATRTHMPPSWPSAAGWSEGPNGPRVLLVSGSRQEIDHQTGRLNVLTFGQNEIDLSDNQGDCR